MHFFVRKHMPLMATSMIYEAKTVRLFIKSLAFNLGGKCFSMSVKSRFATIYVHCTQKEEIW